MTDTILKNLETAYKLEKKDIGEFAKFKVGQLSVEAELYEAGGLGIVSVLHEKMMLGLVKIDSVVINPFEKDVPTFSYDRIRAMGKDKLLLECYETRLSAGAPLSQLSIIKNAFCDLKNGPVKENWYDGIRLFHLYKIGPAKQLDDLEDRLAGEYVRECLAAPLCDPAGKKKAASVFTEGLLSHGGPSTDVFIKEKGTEFTERFFREVFFGTGKPE